MAWWIWSAWIEQPQGAPLPIYSFAAQTNAEPASAERVSYSLPSGRDLVKVEARLEPARGDTWIREIGNVTNEIRLDEILDGAPRLQTLGRRVVQSTAFGQSPVVVNHYVGLEPASELKQHFADGKYAIDFISRELGLDFNKFFSGHLGGFDLFEMKYPFDGPAVFYSDIVRNNALRILRLYRTEPSGNLTVRVCMQSLGETVSQRLTDWENGGTTLDLIIDESVDSTSVEVYSPGSGELIYKEESTYVMEISVDMGITGRTLHLRDNLSKRAGSLGPTAQRRSSEVTALTKEMTGIGSNDIREQVKGMQRAADQMTGWSADRWFARGVGEELGVIDHINSLLNRAQIERAILVDPFFGEDAFRRFILRVQNSDLSLSVITSWGRTDPDTALPVLETAKTNDERLSSLMEAAAPAVACKLRVLNLVTGNGDQAFHDRYLAIYDRSGECQVWALSNSINSMAVNWPFCMSQLNGHARWQAQQYLEGLENGYDLTSSKTITVTYQWPIDQ